MKAILKTANSRGVGYIVSVAGIPRVYNQTANINVRN